MFFKKKPQVVYLQKNSIVVYSKNHPDGVEFEYPEKTIKNHEIVDENKFSDALNTFVAENLIDENSAIVVLSSDTFSQKKLEATDPEEQQKEVEKFVKDSDVKEENLTRETFELDNNRYIMTADKRVYEPILQQIANLGWKITSVIPVSIFRDISDTKMQKNGLNQKETKDIIDNEKLVKDASILSVAPTAQVNTAAEVQKDIKEEPPQEASAKESPPMPTINGATKGPNTNIIILGAIVVILLGALAFLYTQGIFDGIFKTAPVQEEVKKETPTPTATPTPVETEEDKSKLTVKVLNGTGVVGQAGRVKTRLEALDYSEIETENSDTEENTETMVTFSPKVSKDYQEEIVEDLEKIFETVESEVKEDQDVDIEILTGTEK